MSAGLAQESDLKAIDARIRALVTEAAEFAAQSPEPDVGDLEKDVLI